MLSLELARTVVLDTHVWVWASAGDPRANALKSFKGTCVVPAIALWEIAMLESKGRLKLEPTVDQWIQANLAPPVSLEPLSGAIAIESCRLPDFHGDPADRLIVATAGLLGLPLITADTKIHEWNEKHRRLQLHWPG